jgi:hypothetical protein
MQYTPELLDKVIKERYEDNNIDFKETFNWHKFNDYNNEVYLTKNNLRTIVRGLRGG